MLDHFIVCSRAKVWNVRLTLQLTITGTILKSALNVRIEGVYR